MIEVPEGFLEMPLASLAYYGLDEASITLLEERFGVYLKDVVHVTPEDCLRIVGFSRVRLKKFRTALRKCYGELMAVRVVPNMN